MLAPTLVLLACGLAAPAAGQQLLTAAAVFVHGGCWLTSYGIGHVGLLEEAWAEAGYAGWSLEYRRVGGEGGGWPGTYQDVAAGADHLRTLAGTFPLDLERVVASGHSAGGSFGLWLAARDRIPRESELWRSDPLRVGGVLALAPAPDLEGLHAAGVCGNVIDGSWGPVGRTWHRHAPEVGARGVQLLEAPESGHFEMIVPGTSTLTLVMEALAELFRKIAG